MVWEGLNAVKTGRVMLGATNPADSAPGTTRERSPCWQTQQRQSRGRCYVRPGYRDLLVGRLNSVRAVADVTSDLDTEISSDGAGGGVSRVGGSQHHTTSLDSVETLPHHRNHGAAGHVLDEPGEERLLGEISVVVLQKL